MTQSNQSLASLFTQTTCMARRSGWLVFLLTFVLIVPAGQAQTSGGPADDSPRINGKMQLEIIDSVSAALAEVYVFPDVAREVEKYLRRQYKDGVYKDIVSTSDFADKLTDDMQEISEDRHLRIHYVSADEFRYYQEEELTDEEAAKLEEERRKRMERNNFGFDKAERMLGNVGYLRFDGFSDTHYAGATAIAALNFLAYCDALIIDLRYNGGGQPSMIQLITSYFFDEPKHLNSFYVRKENTTQQFWTQAYIQGPRMSDVDLYVLTSDQTFSAAEGFTYDLKNMGRATIIGDTTRGGAHPTSDRLFANLNVNMSLPYGRAINSITGTNWEGTGVEPHIVVPQEDALDVAHIEAMKKLSEKALDEQTKVALLWFIETKEALMNPATVDTAILKSYVGSYGPRVITFEYGALYYQREGRPKFRMIPMSDDLFCFEDIEYFRIKVNVDSDGDPVELVGNYIGGRTDVFPRDPGQ